MNASDMDPLALALIEVYNAVDSRGLQIRLISPDSMSPADIASAAQKTIHHLSRDGVALSGFDPDFDPDKAEENRAVNIRLCANMLAEARKKIARRA